MKTVSISRRSLEDANVDQSASVASQHAKPLVWLGAKSPFGLALPDAHPSASQMYAPRGVWLDSERLIVCDSGNHRVLIWNRIPTEDGAHADAVIGQANFATEGANCGGTSIECGLKLPTGVAVIEGRLVVADAWHHRVLVWNQMPTQPNQQADYAIGQETLKEATENRGQRLPNKKSLYWPYGIGWVDGKFYIADTGNRRILVWDGFPGPERDADGVLGQTNAISKDENRGGDVAANSFRWPHDIAGNAETLFVADAGNHRVLGWQGNLINDRNADLVIGQIDMSGARELPYESPGSRRLRFPYSIAVEDQTLAVADTANNRILFWQLPISETSFPAATDLIGQVDFGGNGENKWLCVGNESLCWPYGIALHHGILAVADSGNNRVMLWDVSAIQASGVAAKRTQTIGDIESCA